MHLLSKRHLAKFLVLLLLLAASNSNAEETRDVLRVCADPNSMPLSNKAGEGYENKIAEILAADLGIPVEYTFFPHRRGFVRHTLRAKDPNTGREKCDLIMGVPTGFELGITTKPYYRSTYAMVFRQGEGLDHLQTGRDLTTVDPEIRDKLRIGIFEQTPGALWVSRHGMFKQAEAFITLHADPDEYPGKVIERDLLNDNVDVAIVWGPIAGYFVKKNQDKKLAMVPLLSETGIRFHFPISMAVRFGEGEWKQQLEQLIDENQDKINAVLADFNVPLVNENGIPF